MAPVPVVSPRLIVMLAVGALVTANTLASIPAVNAARSRLGQLLRTE